MAEAKVSRTQQAFNNIDLIVKNVSMSRAEHLALVDDIVHLKNTIDKSDKRVVSLVNELACAVTRLEELLEAGPDDVQENELKLPEEELVEELKTEITED